MMRALRAEVTKLRRPLFFWLCLAGALLTVAVGFLGQRNAADQYKWVKEMSSQSSYGKPPTARDMGMKPGKKYDRALVRWESDMKRMERQNMSYAQDQIDAIALARRSQHPLGAVGFAATLSASLLGGLLVLMLAGAHVGGEWSGRTIKEMFLHDGRKWRFLAVKILSVWIGAAIMLAAAALALAVFGALTQDLVRLPGSVTWSDAWHVAAPLVGRALVVLLFFAILGTCTGVLLRSTLGSFFVALFLLFASVIAAMAWRSQARFMPGRWLGTWMGFRFPEMVVDHFWVSGSQHATAAHALAKMTLLALALLAVTLVSLSRRDALT